MRDTYRLVKGLKCFVFRVGHASFRRDIDDHKRVASVAREAEICVLRLRSSKIKVD